MEENHDPCSHLQDIRMQELETKYCLTEQRVICTSCYSHCVSLTHLCVNLPISYKEYFPLKQSLHCFLVKGTTFHKVTTNMPLRSAIESFCAIAGLSPQNVRIADPSGNLFDSNTLQQGYVYLLTETYNLLTIFSV